MAARPKSYILLTLMVGLLLAIYLVTINSFSHTPQGSDFAKFYMAGKFLLEGKSIYAPVFPSSLPRPVEIPREEGRSTDKLNPNLNSPFTALLLSPLALLNYPAAFWIWSLLSLAAGMWGFSLIYAETWKKDYEPASLINSWILLLMYFPTWVTVASGQFSLFLVLMLAIVWKTAKRGEDHIAGILLGLAVSLKIFMGIFLIFFAVRRRWRLLLWSLAAVMVCNLLGWLICGIDSYLDYLKVLGGVTWHADSRNASFTGFFTRIFGGSNNMPLWALPQLSRALSVICSSLLMLGVIWLSWPRRRENPLARFDLGFSLSIVAMLLISPLGWMYYFPALAIPLLVSWRVSESVSSTPWDKVIISLAWIFSTVPHLLITSAQMNHPWDWFIWAGFHFYALLLFAGLLLSLSARLDKAVSGQLSANRSLLTAHSSLKKSPP